MNEVSHTNRDPHVLFNQVGMKLGFVPEAIVQGAFLALWVRSNPTFCELLANQAKALIKK
jgi:hypothetical protein